MGNVFSISFDKLVSPCWDFTVKQQKYAREVGKNVDALRNNWEDLKRNYEVDQLLRDACSQQETTNKCLGCKSNYKLGRKLDKKLRKVAILLSNGKFDVVADRLLLVSVEERPSEPTSGLELIFDEVWSYMIRDKQAGIIGLYGMGGVGKTTLLTQLNNKLCNLTIPGFDIVIWVVVSKTRNYTKVQDDIGEKIGFYDNMWKNKSQEKKVMDIFRVLSKMKFVLFLDDIWDRFNLTMVGFPFPLERNMSKVVFTTRSKDVYGRMGAHKKVEVKCLTEEEALNLFREKVRYDTLKAHPNHPKSAVVCHSHSSRLVMP